MYDILPLLSFWSMRETVSPQSIKMCDDNPEPSQAGIPFSIYERDETISSRNQGWAITLHWALLHLQKMLSSQVLQALDSAQVDPEVGRNDTRNFLFLNLRTLEVRFRIPANERRRLSRERLRQVLLFDVRRIVCGTRRYRPRKMK
jgi:hypothetical protein